MAYNVLKSDGTLLITVEDGQVDSGTTSLALVGKNIVNYGIHQNSNFVKLLENFSDNTPPNSPLAGQVWFDNNAGVLKLKFYNGSAWNTIPSLTIASSASNNPTIGEMFFDTDTNRLYLFNGNTQILIGGSNVVSETALRLFTPRKINGINFDGSVDITVNARTEYSLTRGNYLTGGSINFNGSADTTWTVDVGTVQSATANKVVARDSAGDIWFNVGNGTATKARYADLAEKYLADRDYDFGTVMIVGGSAEVCSCDIGCYPIGVVSKNPGYMMNSELDGGTYVALKGRVPVKIIGNVKKGNYLIAGPNGRAQATTSITADIFAVALTDSDDTGYVEAVIL
jgi:hypothetical protein